MDYVIRTHSLTKVFDGKEVVSDVGLSVKKNEIYGFLGPNGAGKTTVMRMITNLVKPTNGEVELFGRRLIEKSYEVLKRMSSIIEYPAFYEHLSGKANLEIHREYMGYNSPGCVENALKMLDLADTNDKPVREYSLGMKQRLGLARAILTKPELIVLDEPTNGLDPAGIKQIRDFLKALSKEQGITIMISSHNLPEIENLVDTVGLINKGKLIKELSLGDIQSANLSYIELAVNDVKQAAYVLAEHLQISSFKIMDSSFIRIYDLRISTNEVSKQMVKNNVSIDSISKKNDSLEDYFLKMTMGAE